MPRVLRGVAATALVLAIALLAFAGGSAAFRMVQARGDQQQRVLYRSVLRVAGREPLSVPMGSLAAKVDLAPLDLFHRVEQHLRQYYYGKIESNAQLAFGAADGMLDALSDPNSRFLEPDQVRAFRDRQDGVYPGIGAILATRKVEFTPLQPPASPNGSGQPKHPDGEGNGQGDEPRPEDAVDMNSMERAKDGRLFHWDVFIAAVLPGGPAEAAGLRPGDVIRAVNGQSVLARNLDSLEQMLLVPRQGRVELTVSRQGSPEPIKVGVGFGVTRVAPVSTHTSDGVTVIRVRTLWSGAADAVQAEARKALDGGSKGIVLDLRGNADGDFSEACGVASVFIPSGPVARLKERGGKLVEVPAVSGRSVGTAERLAVLVDRGTAGPAEIVAAAFKGRNGARLVGTKTLGQGSRQEFFSTEGDTGLLLTTGLVLLPASGEPFDGKGVAPDVVVAENAGTQDAALHRAVAWVRNGAA